MRIGMGLAILTAAAALTPPAAVGQSRPPLLQGLDVRVIEAPRPVRIDGQPRLVHELMLSNFASTPLEVTGLEVADAGTGRTILALGGAALDAALGGSRTVPSGGFVLAYVDASDAIPPDRLVHRVTFMTAGDGAARAPITVQPPETPVVKDRLPVLGPPLRGGPWVAVYQPDMERGHRRVAYAVDGEVRIPGRFAIDWIKVDESGATGASADQRLESNLSFGAEVLAVADGVVVATRDGVPDPADLNGAGAVALEDATGNYIVLDIGGGHYAFYEHLSPGLRVVEGERVRQGQVIGALGFTGQASGPHLHFHLADGPEPLPAEGRPYLLSGRRAVGGYASIEAFGRGEAWTPALDAGDGGPSFPAPNVVVFFED